MSTPATPPPPLPAIPDTQALELSVINLQTQYGQLVINSDNDIVTANGVLDTIDGIRKDKVSVDLNKAITGANAVHKFLTGLRTRFLDPLDKLDKDLRSGIAGYLKRKEDAAEALRKQQEAENLRKHEEEVRLAQEAQKRALEEANPWEDAPAPVPVPKAPAPPPVARVTMPVTGLGKRKLPAKAELQEWEEKGVHGAGFKALLTACAERLKNNDESLLGYFSFNQVAANGDAQRWGKTVMEEKVPGVTVVIGETMVRR